ncbi:queuosine precursor transporter [Candidatus Woesearchaeota archaeon]|nr:queuosine precursor transporter [Candidatus Woesearchaeota archaeon]
MELREAFRPTLIKNILQTIAFLILILCGVDIFSYSGLLVLVIILINVYIGVSVLSYLNSRLDKEKKVYLLLGLFIGALAAANLVGSKVATVYGITASVGILAYPLTFLITDGIAEVYGKKKTRSFVWAGFLSQIFIFILVLIAVKLPPATRYTVNAEFVTVYSMSLRMIAASMTAFLISQLHDIWAFHFWKKKTKGKYLWLRNNFSTIVSQFIDTMIFMYLAFYMMTPKFTAAFVFSISIPYYILKVVMALLDTPFCYLLVRWLKKEESD